MKRRALLVSAVAALATASGLTVAASLSPASAAPAAGAAGGPAAVLARMSLQQRVGQLFMAGVPASGPVSSAISTDISTYHTGSVILTGRSSAGVTATRQLTNQLRGLATSAATDGVPLFMATDQEGGNVQVLSGTGFSTMPTALSQGSETTSQLRANAASWGSQLAAAGVNLNLAPVLDTVPASRASTNQPIGIYRREYGYTPAAVTSAGTAFIQGMRQAGVSTAIKHFPGLGRASGNTDTTYGVTDSATTYNDPYLQPYATAVSSDGAQVVMVSEAIYTQIDASHQAVFSPTVIGGMLRGELGFHGMIMSDSMEAAAVSELTPAQRAVDFINAGGDLVLATDPTVVPAMYNAVLAQAQSSPSFATLVSQAAMTVLIAKQRTRLLGANGGVLGDVTGDGRPDIVAVDGTGHMYMYPNTGGIGSGMFGARTLLGTGWTGYTVAAVTSLTGSGRAGLLAISPGGSLLYYPNSGKSTFAYPPDNLGGGWTGYTIAGLADVHGTGHPGILAVNPAGNLLFYPGNGTGTFGYPPENLGTGWTGYTIDCADINGDGKPDLLAVSPAGNQYLYPGTGGTGTHTFGFPPTLTGSGWNGFQAVDAGFLTGAKGADILAINSAGNMVLYPNTGGTGTHTFGFPPTLVATGWTGYVIN